MDLGGAIFAAGAKRCPLVDTVFNSKAATMKYRLILLLLLFSSCGERINAQLSLRIVKDSLFIPWEILWGPDDKIWLTQKNGFICRLDPKTRKLDTLYREAATLVQSEAGMMGLALHPQFTTQPYVYAAHNYSSGSRNFVRVIRYTYNGTNALGSPTVLIDSIAGGSIHNGCRLLAVGDKLYVTTGESGNTSLSQNIQSINGKVLRINLDGTIPADNPIPGSRLWSWGHRNAQGMVMAKGKLYISEHGDVIDDEINQVFKGRNYGWPIVKGYCDLPGETTFCTDSQVVEPMAAWSPTLAVCGLDYYDGAMFPAWKGSLLLATLKDSKLYFLPLSPNGDTVYSANVIPEVGLGRLRDICISPDGRIYVSTSNSNANGTGLNRDMIVEIYDASANVGVSQPKQAGRVELYPNPADDELFVRYRGTDARFRVTNALGQKLAEGKLSGGSGQLQVGSLARGLYFLILEGKDFLAAERFEKK